MNYRYAVIILGLIILLVCIVGCTSTAPPTSKITPSPSAKPTTTPTGSCLELVSGKYVSVKGGSWNVAGTPDNYATLEINTNTNTGVLSLPGNVFQMKISKHKSWTCASGGWTWTAENPPNSGDLTVVGQNPDKIVIFGDLYFDRLDFVKF
jgi:hypothetical protein